MYYFKTYSYTLTKDDIIKILERKMGYKTMSFAKVLNLIPSISKSKFRIFTDFLENEDNLGEEEKDFLAKENPPSPFYSVKFAWRTEKELAELKLALCNFAETWKDKKGWIYGSWIMVPPSIEGKAFSRGGNNQIKIIKVDTRTLRNNKTIRKYMIEEIIGDLIKQEVDKITNLDNVQ